jgi:hypothetical protein
VSDASDVQREVLPSVSRWLVDVEALAELMGLRAERIADQTTVGPWLRITSARLSRLTICCFDGLGGSFVHTDISSSKDPSSLHEDVDFAARFYAEAIALRPTDAQSPVGADGSFF